MADKDGIRVTEMDAAESLENDDLLMVVQGNRNKKATLKSVSGYIASTGDLDAAVTAAQKAQNAASSSASAAKTSETNAADSASAAKTSQNEAEKSANNASVSETNAGKSASAAASSASQAATSASNADKSQSAAKSAETGAANSSKEAQSWAVGGTNTRSGENTDNAKYYSQVAANNSVKLAERVSAVQAKNLNVAVNNESLTITWK